jgi:hypothetical protein
MTEETDNALLNRVNEKQPRDTLRIRGKSYKIRGVWYSVLNPQAPPVVYVERDNHDNLPADNHG